MFVVGCFYRKIGNGGVAKKVMVKNQYVTSWERMAKEERKLEGQVEALQATIF